MALQPYLTRLGKGEPLTDLEMQNLLLGYATAIDSLFTTVTGGITSLNGLTGTTQTFAVGTSGITFNISSSGTTHTFNIPMASSVLTTAGLLSNTDYAKFNNAVFTVNSVTATLNDIALTVANTGTSLTWAGLQLRIPTASGTVTGLLSNTDWTTFNSKPSTLATLTDTNIVGPTNLQILQYDTASGKWKNQTLSAYVQNGNDFGATAVLGTTGNNSLQFITDNIVRATIANDGKFNVGLAAPLYAFSVQNELFYDGGNNLGVSKSVNNGLNFNITNNNSGTTASAIYVLQNDLGSTWSAIATSSVFTTVGNAFKANRNIHISNLTDGMHFWNQVTAKSIVFWNGAALSEIQTFEMGATFTDNKVSNVLSGTQVGTVTGTQIAASTSVYQMNYGAGTANLPTAPKTGQMLDIIFGALSSGTFTITSSSSNILKGAAATNTVTFPAITAWGTANATRFWYNGTDWLILYP